MDSSARTWWFTRRAVLQTGAVVSLATLAVRVLGRIGKARAQGASHIPDPAPQVIPVNLTINGEKKGLQLDSRTTLLDALRNHLQLTGSKKGCDHGQCGACTVLINDRRTNSCLTLAVMHEGDDIKTIEGIGTLDHLHPMQAAFVEHDGFQCGYCTPGQICSAIGMLKEAKSGMPSHVTADLQKDSVELTDAEIRERMSGNICRCAAYPNIVAAIKDAEKAA